MIWEEEMKPVYFWPYASVVFDRILEIHYTSKDPIAMYQSELINKFKDMGAHVDNKIVFEFLHVKSGRHIYIGFYDWVFSVGFSMDTDEYNIKKRDAIRVKEPIQL